MSPQTPPTDRPITAGEPLWMVHVLGPDEIYPAPDHATAVEWCAGMNEAIPESDVLCVAVPALWTGSSKDHAAGLKDARDAFSALASPAMSAASEGEVVNDDVMFLLMKRGLYYRPNAMGYTGIKDHAGRYTEDEARSHAEWPSGVTAIRAVDAPDFSEACFDDLARAHLTKKLDEAKQTIAALASPPVSERERELAFGVDDLAQEIRRVDGNHSLGAGALAEALMPFLTAQPQEPV